MPAVGKHSTANYFVVQGFFCSVDESSSIGNIKNNVFNSHFLGKISHVTSNPEQTDDNDAVTKR